ncbi:MAG TPA: ABC transporter substrate-binding protein [Clostridiales bacterium]|nr:ABC transporter substrate-binding protein [Clostridiales bacterium]
MKKKTLAVVLSIALVLGGLAGCSGSQAPTDAKPTAGQSDASSSVGDESNSQTSGENGELTEIIWQWPSTGSTNTGFQAVEDALNAMMEPDIGVHVTLEPVSFSNLANETVLAVSSGEQLDLCLSVGTGVGSLVSTGLIEPLDDIIDAHGASILEKCGSAMSGGYYDGKLYGMPNAYIQGESYGYIVRQDLLDKYGISVDENKFYTLDEIEKIFATVKAGEGNNFFCQIPEATSEEPLSRVAFEYDKLGATSASGFLMLNKDFKNMTISNVYETEEYEAYANLMYEWAQKGYISKDAATNTEDRNVLISGGNYLGYFGWSTPGAIWDTEAQTGYDLAILKVIDGYTAGDRFQSILWSVPITSVNPKKAVEALNYIYEHKEAAWLLQYGIEGQDYEVLEQNEEGTLIKYLSADPSTLPYFQPFGVYGDRLAWPLMSPSPINKNAIIREFSDNIPDSRKSPALGYCFNVESVSTEYSAVSAVIQQYIPSMNCGTLNPETNLAEFKNALKSAGIDKVIAENQRQLDEWAANR